MTTQLCGVFRTALSIAPMMPPEVSRAALKVWEEDFRSLYKESSPALSDWGGEKRVGRFASLYTTQ
jgi:hypothetical protein